MVRTFTTDQVEHKRPAQWLAAWNLLPTEWQRAIAVFCLNSDYDVAQKALKIRSA